MKITKGVALFLFLMILSVGMVGATTASTNSTIYADTNYVVSPASTDVTYALIPVNVSASGQLLYGFTIDIPELVDTNGYAYAIITPSTAKNKKNKTILVTPNNDFVDPSISAAYQWNEASPNSVVWSSTDGIELTSEMTMFYLNVTVNGSMRYPGSVIPINVNVRDKGWSIDVGGSSTATNNVTNVTTYITVDYPELTTVTITEPTGSLAYKATGTANATSEDQFGNDMSSVVVYEWNSSDPAAVSINNKTGAYQVISCYPGTVTLSVNATAFSTSVIEQVVISLTKATPVKENFTYPTTFADFEWTGLEQNYTSQIGLNTSVYGLNYSVVYTNGTVEKAPIDYGKYTVIARVNSSSANYTATDVELGSYNITKKQIPIPTLNSYSYTYNKSSLNAPITLVPANYTVSGATTAIAAGTHNITVALADQTNTVWSDNTVANLTFSWTIDQKVITGNATVTLDKTNESYNATAITASVSNVTLASPWGNLSSTDYSVSGETSEIAVGMYTVTVTGKGNYTGTASATWNITKADPKAADFTCNPTLPKQIEFDGQPHTIAVTSTKVTSFTTKYYNATSKAEVTSPTTYGTYIVNASVSGDVNYTDANVTLGQFEITKTLPKVANFTCELPSDLVYNMSQKLANVTSKIPELVGKFTVIYNQSGVTVSPIAAGTYDVVVQTQDTTNYTATTLTLQSFTITQKPMSGANITLDNTAFTYDGTEKNVSVTEVNFSNTWVLATTDYNVSGTTDATAVDTYTVTVTGKGNYTGTETETWTIDKATPVVANFTASNASGTVTFPLDVDFNNSEHTVTVTAASGVYGMGTITTTYTNVSSGSVETPKKVGSYYVNISTVAGANFTAVSDLHLGIINVTTRSYNISYVTNGGSAIANESYNAGVDTKVLNTSTTRTGYHLGGWYANSGLTGSNVTEVTITDFGDKTFYAKWINNTYLVYFNKNSTLATGTMANQSFTYDAPAVALTANAFQYPGYHFANWTNATGTLFADKEAVQNLNATDGGITTLSAVWAPNNYTVHFEGTRNTSGSMTDQTFTYDTAQALSPNGFVRAGYTFANWTTKSDGNGTAYADGESVQNLTTDEDGTVTLYAKWTANASKVYTNVSGTITLPQDYVVIEIDVNKTQIINVTFNYDQSVHIPIRSGYHDQTEILDAFNITLVDGEFNGGYAVIIFNVSVTDIPGGVSNADKVWLAHQKDGKNWEFLKTTQLGADSEHVKLSAVTTSFSPFYPVYMVPNAVQSTTTTSSSRHSGGSTILRAGETAPIDEPTVEPTVAPTQASSGSDSPSVPVVNPTTQSTQASPAPFIGLLAGLGAVAVFLRRRR